MSTQIFDIPDIDLPLAAGGSVNPAHLAGHELIVLFCPAGSEDAAAELEAYDRHCADMTRIGGWILAVAAPGAEAAAGCSRIAVAIDADGRAWSAFARVAKADAPQPPPGGAAFLFTRGGALLRSWFGSGHDEEVIEELRRRR